MSHFNQTIKQSEGFAMSHFNQTIKQSNNQTIKRGFSLVELLVVVAIIAILAGVLMASFGGGTASARAARCLSNMKNLAGAAQTYAMEKTYHPLAGNIVHILIKNQRGGHVKKEYDEVPGWISANSQNMFPKDNLPTSFSKPETVSLYSDDREAATYALTNGVLWKYVSGSRETYICPEHAKKMGKNGTQVNWSYLMNAYFGWDKAGRARSHASSGRLVYGRDVAHLDKVLLFAEVPFMGFNGWQPEGTGGSTDTDAILQYSESGLDDGSKTANSGGGSDEEIGVNHKSGREYCAHVAFADGHVEKLRVPMDGKKPDTAGFANVTSWLCAGYDISFDGNKYNRVK